MRQKLIKPIVKTVKVSEESERVSQSSVGGDLPSSTEASDLPPTDGVRLATLRDLINQMVTDKSYQEGNRIHTHRLLHFYLDAGVCKIPRFAQSHKSIFQT